MDYYYRHIKYGSKEYAQECHLRHQELRIPLGLPLSNIDTVDEQSQYHFGVFNSHNHLVGSVIAKPINHHTIKIRQMVIASDNQNQGLGQALLKFAESYCWKKSYRLLTLHARTTAVDFYIKQGYQICSDKFVEVGLPHFKMKKSFLNLSKKKLF